MDTNYIPYDEIKPTNSRIKLDLEMAGEGIQSGMPVFPLRLIEKVGKDHSGNQLILGDCIEVCGRLKKENIKVDLVYIDPPFFSGTDYKSKIYFRGRPDSTEAFEMVTYNDKWSQDDYLKWIYLCFRAIHSIMSENGSIYVHLDWHICHYVKIILDEIFGQKNYLNEIIWSYKSGGASQKSFSKKHDTIYLYAKNKGKHIYNSVKEKSYNRQFKPYNFKGVEEFQDDIGWYTLVNPRDVWEIDMVGRTSRERVDYITQKPEALLEKMILASSQEGMIVADFFGGSGVTASVAAKHNRRFVHCDISSKSIQVARDRLKLQQTDFDVYEVDKGEKFINSSGQLEVLIENQNQDYLLRIKNYFHPKTESRIEEHFEKKDRNVLLSESRIELIEMVSVMFENDDLWHSDYEVRIAKNGDEIINDQRTDQKWSGLIALPQRPCRIKVRDICGEETILCV